MKEAEIIRLYYEEHKRPTDIADILKVSKPYITKVIQKDKRYIREKEFRSSISKERRKESKRNDARKRRKQAKEEYQAMINQINTDNIIASKQTRLSDVEFAKWNRGAYKQDKVSGDLILRDDINTGYNVPKKVSNIVNPDCIKRAV